MFCWYLVNLFVIFYSNKNDIKDGIFVFVVVEFEKIFLRKFGLLYRYCFCRKGNKFMENEFFF